VKGLRDYRTWWRIGTENYFVLNGLITEVHIGLVRDDQIYFCGFWNYGKWDRAQFLIKGIYYGGNIDFCREQLWAIREGLTDQ